MTERFSAEWWQREFEGACDRANRLEAERDALLRAVAPLVDRDHVTPLNSVWEFWPTWPKDGYALWDNLNAAFNAVDEGARSEALAMNDG